jgi:hypothetical protein
MSDVSVTFGADASDLIQALQQIDADLKAMIESLGAVVQSSTEAGAALAKMADSSAASVERAGQRMGKAGDPLKKATKEWEQAFHPVDRAFTESISGIIRGTQTAQQAIRRFSQSITASFIDDAEKSLTKWLSTELAKTTATQIGAGARATAEDQSQSTGLVKMVELALKAIGVDASKTFADVFAFFAPDMGPAAAAPAAAAQGAVMAVAGGIAVADVGIWDVPRDMLAYIHQGETVMPANFADGFRSAASGSRAGGGPSAQIAIHAMDGASVKRVLGANHGAVAAALRRAWRHGSGGLR